MPQPYYHHYFSSVDAGYSPVISDSLNEFFAETSNFPLYFESDDSVIGSHGYIPDTVFYQPPTITEHDSATFSGTSDKGQQPQSITSHIHIAGQVFYVDGCGIRKGIPGIRVWLDWDYVASRQGFLFWLNKTL